jgi:hypothetical protein
MIIKPEEYAALKAAGLITVLKRPDGSIRIKIDRGEREDQAKSALLTWLESEMEPHKAAIARLEAIKADIDPL